MNTDRRARAGLGILGALMAARAVDAVLVGSAVAAAAGSVVFAGLMLMQGDHPPNVNGLEYLAIFAKPHSAAKPVDQPTPNSAAVSLDMSPVGAITTNDNGKARGYVVVAAQLDFAWVREGSRIFSVRPGDEVPGLGHINAIVSRGGRWLLIGEAGAPLLASGGPELAASRPAPFARRMIFDGEN